MIHGYIIYLIFNKGMFLDMYENHKTSYCFYNPSKYSQIKPSSHVFIPDLNLIYLVLSPGKWIALTEDSDNQKPAAAGLTIGFGQSFGHMRQFGRKIPRVIFDLGFSGFWTDTGRSRFTAL